MTSHARESVSDGSHQPTRPLSRCRPGRRFGARLLAPFLALVIVLTSGFGSALASNPLAPTATATLASQSRRVPIEHSVAELVTAGALVSPTATPTATPRPAGSPSAAATPALTSTPTPADTWLPLDPYAPSATPEPSAMAASAEHYLAYLPQVVSVSKCLPEPTVGPNGLRYGVIPSTQLFRDQYTSPLTGDAMPHYKVVADMGFKWIKIWVSWRDSEANRGEYHFEGLDYRVQRALPLGLNVLLIVWDAPQWANGAPVELREIPPFDEQPLGEFGARLAAHYANQNANGRIAYELWNEPNTAGSLGGQSPDAAKYTRMLKAFYPRVKAADPHALVVSGGLANTGDGTPNNPSDLSYIRDLVSLGAADYFDALGVHPYGGPYAPEVTHAQATMGTFFRRAEEEHDVLVQSLGHEKAVWATEFGWLVDPAVDGRPNTLDYHFHQMTVPTEEIQADFTARAYQYAAAHWPWLGMLMLTSLDLNLDPWRNWNDADPMNYYAIMRPNLTLRPAWYRLRDIAKLNAAAAPPPAGNTLPLAPGSLVD